MHVFLVIIVKWPLYNNYNNRQSHFAVFMVPNVVEEVPQNGGLYCNGLDCNEVYVNNDDILTSFFFSDGYIQR